VSGTVCLPKDAVLSVMADVLCLCDCGRSAKTSWLASASAPTAVICTQLRLRMLTAQKVLVQTLMSVRTFWMADATELSAVSTILPRHLLELKQAWWTIYRYRSPLCIAWRKANYWQCQGNNHSYAYQYPFWTVSWAFMFKLWHHIAVDLKDEKEHSFAKNPVRIG